MKSKILKTRTIRSENFFSHYSLPKALVFANYFIKRKEGEGINKTISEDGEKGFVLWFILMVHQMRYSHFLENVATVIIRHHFGLYSPCT